MIYEADDMLNAVQAAGIMGRGVNYVRDLCERGELPHECNGRGERRKHYRIRYGALRDWLDGQEAKTETGQTTAAPEPPESAGKRGVLGMYQPAAKHMDIVKEAQGKLLCQPTGAHFSSQSEKEGRYDQE